MGSPRHLLLIPALAQDKKLTLQRHGPFLQSRPKASQKEARHIADWAQRAANQSQLLTQQTYLTTLLAATVMEDTGRAENPVAVALGAPQIPSMLHPRNNWACLKKAGQTQYLRQPDTDTCKVRCVTPSRKAVQLLQPRQLSWYSDYATAWKIRVSTTGC